MDCAVSILFSPQTSYGSTYVPSITYLLFEVKSVWVIQKKRDVEICEMLLIQEKVAKYGGL
jgi:hypothetical protein